MQTEVDSGVGQHGFLLFRFYFFFYDTALSRHRTALTQGLAKLVLHSIQAAAGTFEPPVTEDNSDRHAHHD